LILRRQDDRHDEASIPIYSNIKAPNSFEHI
jgi:hypothetical protein